MDKISTLRREICDISKKAFEEGLFTGTSGNLSAYIPEKGLMLITPTHVRYDVMKYDDIVLMDLDGNQVEGELKPSSEWRMHAYVYKHMHGVTSVFHTHSPCASAFASVRQDVPCILIEMSLNLGGGVPCTEFAVPGTWEVGQVAVQAMNGRYACLLANHGVLAVGSDVEEAYTRAEYVEDASKVCLLAKQLGTPIIMDE